MPSLHTNSDGACVPPPLLCLDPESLAKHTISWSLQPNATRSLTIPGPIGSSRILLTATYTLFCVVLYSGLHYTTVLRCPHDQQWRLYDGLGTPGGLGKVVAPPDQDTFPAGYNPCMLIYVVAEGAAQAPARPEGATQAPGPARVAPVLPGSGAARVTVGGLGLAPNRVILEASTYTTQNTIGDFEWEVIASLRAPAASGHRTLWIFNDNLEDRRSSRGGGGNACIRPFNSYGAYSSAPLAAGVTTGSKDRGFSKLTQKARTAIDEDLAIISKLLATGQYCHVRYSADRTGDLGCGIFATTLGQTVKTHIMNGLRKAVTDQGNL
jgi:hypothetical protein